LGRDGNWQRVGLPGDVDVDLLGWSFPGRHHADDPLDSPGLTEALAGRRSGAAILGLLHCDLDGGTSPYAPVARHRLVSMGLDGWFLGHIHVPDDLQGQPPLGYLGSLVGLNRGETGVHGPCRVTIHGPGRLAVERVVVGPVVWLDVEVSASGVSDDASAEDELHARIQRAFQLRAETLPQGPDAGDRAVACSVTLVGEVGARARVRDFASKITPAQLRFQVDGQTWIAIRLRDATRPAVDLAVLARQPTPLGVVASLILALETSGPAAHEVQALAKTVIEPFGAGRWQVDDQRHPPGDGGAELLSAARRLLDALLAQAPAQGGG
jgi:hypothetical protein